MTPRFPSPPTSSHQVSLRDYLLICAFPANCISTTNKVLLVRSSGQLKWSSKKSQILIMSIPFNQIVGRDLGDHLQSPRKETSCLILKVQCSYSLLHYLNPCILPVLYDQQPTNTLLDTF